jgi:hypothetical protein
MGPSWSNRFSVQIVIGRAPLRTVEVREHVEDVLVDELERAVQADDLRADSANKGRGSAWTTACRSRAVSTLLSEAELVQPPEGVDELEPADEVFLRAPLRTQASAHRLCLESHGEPQ